MFFDPELFSAVSASAMPTTLRANSMKAYWNPPQVASSGQSRRRANSMPLSMPSKLLYGLPGAGHKPSEISKILSAVGAGGGGGERGCGQPLGFNFESQLAGGVLDGIGGGVVRTKFGIEVSQNSNANGVGHAGIVLEGITLNGRIARG